MITRSSFSSLLAFMLLLEGACTYSPGKGKLKTAYVTYPNGRVKTMYSYYLNHEGKEILQGEMLQFSPLGGLTGMATKSVYDKGRLVEGPHETTVTE